MKRPRLISIVLSVCLAGVAACSGGETVGGDLDTDNIKVRDTTSPTPKPQKTKVVKPTKQATPTEQPTPKGPAPKTWKVVATPGNTWDPYDVVARVGDKIVFRNESDGDTGHSFVVEGTDIDSGEVAAGGTWSTKANIPTGTYDFVCGIIPYMVGGKLIVYQ